MAIEDILKALEDQAKADIDAVLTEAREHAALIETQAQAEATAIRDGFVKQVERNATSKASKLVNAARLEAKMTVSSARGEALESVFDAASRRLAQARTEADYDRLFAALVSEALDGLDGEVVVHVDPSDEALALSLVDALAAGSRVVTDLSTAGGVVIEANGGRIVRRNTLEDRLERARQQVQTDVAKALFA